MDFRHIRAFIAVADALSVTKAAERLRLTQPALTRHLRQLERELGTELFVRHRSGMRMTEAGHRLLAKARTLDTAATDFVDAARTAASGTGGTLRLGIAWGLWDLAHRIRVEFASHNPDVAVEATDAFCHITADEQVKNGALDVVFARPPYDPALQVSEPIVHEPIHAVLSDRCELARHETVGIRDLARYPLLLWDRHMAPALYDRVLALYAEAGVHTPMIPTPGAGPYNHGGMTLVASRRGVYVGLGVLTGPPSGVVVRPLSDPGATIEVCAVSRRDDASRIVARFLASVWEVFPREARLPRMSADVA